MSRRKILLVGGYLTAIVLANLTVSWWGPRMMVINSLLFIGLDLTARDGLHELWQTQGWGFVPRMGALIATGSVITIALNLGATRIAVASFVAFAVAAVVDTLVFHLARRLDRQDRANASNIVAAAVDSVLFPTLAFGALMWDTSVAMWGAKVAGGAIWVWIIWGMRRTRPSCDWCGEYDDEGEDIGTYHPSCGWTVHEHFGAGDPC
jgi:hypothetical protein